MKKMLLLSAIFALVLGLINVNYAVTYSDTIDTKYEGIVECLASLKIVNGTSENTFEPNKVVTRAEMAKMLVVAHGYDNVLNMIDTTKTFKDVKKGSWYYDYVNLANAYGLVKGYPDGNFYPDKTVTYSEAVAMILRSLGHKYIKEDSKFGWDYDYIIRMRSLELNKGIEVFNNTDYATRGDIAVFIWNMLHKTKWEASEENGIGDITYSDTREVLFERVFGDDYDLIDNQKIRGISAENGDMYINVGMKNLKLEGVLPIYALGAMMDGVYSNAEKKLICATYDSGCGIEQGDIDQLEEEGYELSLAKDKYSFGGLNAQYAFFIVKREDDGKLTFDRAITLDLNNKIKVEKTKTEKDILKINDYIEVDTSEAILIDGNKKMDWKKLAKGDLILCVEEDRMYICVDDYIVVDEEKKEDKKIDSAFYYISSIIYASKNNAHIFLSKDDDGEMYESSVSLDKLSVGDAVIAKFSGDTVTEIKKANESDYKKLELDEKLMLNLKTKTYKPGMLAGYKITDDTNIFVVDKKFRNNSDKYLESCDLIREDEDILEDVEDEVINVIVDSKTNELKAVYIERIRNKFPVFYAMVREVIQEGEKLNVTISPIGEIITTCEANGIINCEPGDIISYTLTTAKASKDEKDKKEKFVIKIDEVYRKGVIGYEKDLVVESVNKDVVTLTNGETFDTNDSKIEVNGKVYRVSEYLVIMTDVANSADGWRFKSGTFEEFSKVKFAKGDRIAIDELENVIVIYSGYEAEEQ